METSTGRANLTDGGTPPESRWSPATRCYVMGLVWGFVGFAVTYFAYNDRMVVLEAGAISVVRNDQGMLAGYCAMAFGAVWLLAGIVLSLRRGSGPDA